MAPERPLARPIAIVVWLLAAGIPVGILMLVFASPTPERDAWALPLYGSIVATWGLTGAFLATRRPGNSVGWVMLVAGIGIGLALLGQMWAYRSLAMVGGTAPGTLGGAMLGVLFNPMLYLVMLVPILFPDGRPMSRRWAVVAAVLIVSAGSTLVGTIARPGPIEGMPELDNPLGLPALGGGPQALIDIGGTGSVICLAAGILASVIRYRRGTHVEREQLKWFGSVVGFGFSMFFAATLLPQPFGQLAWIGASISLGLMPVAIGIAILRYRLYDIDRIVSRTLAYALVTALLAAAFVGTNLALQALLVDATGGGSTLTTAVSTLVVAGLFQPLRRRVQAPIDRRFNRARVDGERVVAAFAGQVRDQVDLDRLRIAAVAAVDDAVAPAVTSIWLRTSR